MKKEAFFIFISLYFNSCTKGGGQCDGGLSSDVQIHYIDNQSNNLFNNISKKFSIDSISVYDLQNNLTTILIRYYDSSKNIVDFRTSAIFKNNYSKNLIHLKTGIDDTLICHFSGVANEVCNNIDSVWYNGVLETTNNNKAITIVK